MSQALQIDTRIAELLQWSAGTGQPLPMPVAAILTAEDAGLVVDLETGETSAEGWATAFLSELLGPEGTPEDGAQ